MITLAILAIGCGSGVTPEGDSDNGFIVSSTSPPDGATGVGTNASVTATFSAALDNSTVTSETFLLTEAATGTGVDGTVSVSGAVAAFTPSAGLSANTAYTATLSDTIADLSGATLGADYSWSFTTGSGAAATVSFSADIQPLFDANCTSGCHSPGGTAAFLDLSEGASWGNIVNQPSTRTSYSTGETTLVVPYDSASSVLYLRISRTADGEQQMPQGRPPLSTADQGAVRTWIDEGGQNN